MGPQTEWFPHSNRYYCGSWTVCLPAHLHVFEITYLPCELQICKRFKRPKFVKNKKQIFISYFHFVLKLLQQNEWGFIYL